MLNSISSAVLDGSAASAVVMENSVSPAAIASEVEAIVESVATLQLQSLVNLDQGDPTMYEPYWRNVGENINFTMSASQNLSYFANPNSFCWFLMPSLEKEIKILHNLAGNANVEGYHIVVGNGSSQLIQAAFYALADPLHQLDPVSVVSAAPFYSCYPQIADFVRSRLFKWGGDANKYTEDGAYIELVTSPNNPDGEMRGAVVNRAEGMVVHDLAYYWPQYTPVTAPADHNIMLFTVSKCTGHAGSRIGWALVKDSEVAKKMVKFIEINTIGVSKEAQLRAARILEKISTSCHGGDGDAKSVNFFESSQFILAERWRRLREALSKYEVLQVPDFPPQYCNFNRDFVEPHPAYAWVKSQPGVDLAKVLGEHNIRVRGGSSFGTDVEHARISMLGREGEFNMFILRLPAIMQQLDALKSKVERFS